MKRPIMPYAPSVPIKPVKKIVSRKTIATVNIEKYHRYSIKDFIEELASKSQSNFETDNLYFEFEVEEERGYYDDYTTSINVNIFNTLSTDDPVYDKKYEKYLKDLEKYKLATEKYKKDLKQYKEDQASFERETDKANLEFYKKAIIKLEKKLKEDKNV